MSYSAQDIVGKTLYAVRRIPVRRLPADDAPIVTYIVPGQPVGVVYSFLEPRAGRSTLYWQFKDSNGPYYTPHQENFYDLDQLRAQGVLTLEEKKEAEKPYVEQFGNKIANGLLLFGGLWIGLQAFKTFK